MAQTSPEDLERKGLENNLEAEPDKSPKSAQDYGVRTPHWGKGERTHIKNQRGRRVRRQSGGGSVRIRGTAVSGKQRKLRVSG